jgi:thiamine biosynthesis lipoprotein
MGEAPRRGTGETRALTRRRVIRIVAAGAGLPLMMAAVRATAPPPQMAYWQGEVLGALSELTLWHPDAAFSRRTIARVRGEIARYERIFSLYRPDSEISRLNAAGTLGASRKASASAS